MKIDFTKPFILDGATGTELQKLGCERGVCPETWVLENPDAIKKVQSAYAKAGADCVYAPTFGANRVTMAGHSVTEEIGDFCQKLVDLSRVSVPETVLVGGDIAPCGLSLEPYGNATYKDLVDVFTEQAQALEQAGVDFFVVETQMSIAEAKATIVAVRSVSDKPIFASFAVNNSGRSFMGANIVSALIVLQELDIDAFGINCCSDMELVEALVKEMYPYSKLPLIVKPNAGMPDMSTGEAVYSMTAKDFADSAVKFVKSGASLLGGCCGTDHEHIAAMKLAVADMQTLPVAQEFKNMAASQTAYHAVTENSMVIDVAIDDDLQESMEEAIEKGADLLGLHISSEADIDLVDEYQHCLFVPLSVSFENEELKEKFKATYHGKAHIK